MPGQPAARARDPFGLGAPAAPQAPTPRQPEPALDLESKGDEIALDLGPPSPEPVKPAVAVPAPVTHSAPAAARSSDGGEAALRDALSKASREVIEKIAWEVVPQLAETIIREELERLIKDREGKA